jgi:hypothetical protein
MKEPGAIALARGSFVISENLLPNSFLIFKRSTPHMVLREVIMDSLITCTSESISRSKGMTFCMSDFR